MIYLFDRLYLETDHNIRNDKKKMAALLGPSAAEAKSCLTLQYDFGKIQLDEEVSNADLPKYLQDLVVTSGDQRAVVYTTDEYLIKILAYYCSSIFDNPSPEFVKELILVDKMWIDASPGAITHTDFALRHKGLDELDISNIDALIAEGMAITPKLTNMSELRLEYLFAPYLAGKLSPTAKEAFEEKIKVIFYDSNWMGQLVKTITPMILTFLAKEGMDLDTFTIDDLRTRRPAYFKIFDEGVFGDETSLDRVTLEDWMAFLDQSTKDFGWQPWDSLKTFLTDFYTDKDAFIKAQCLDPNNLSNYYCGFDMGKINKVNPYLWYTIAREHNNPAYLGRFSINV